MSSGVGGTGVFAGLDVRGALRAAAARIAAADVGDTARLDAELLVGHVTGLDRGMLRARDDQPLTSAQAAQLEALVDRRAGHEPVQYVLGAGWFYGLELDVDPRVLIPRPETELLVDLALTELERRGAAQPAGPVLRVVDACTGSGCVAIAVAVEAQRRFGPGRVEVVATDLSADALKVATANVRRHAAAVQLRHGSLLEPLDPTDCPIDVLVANPPYVPAADAAAMAPSVVDHEPHVALFVPDDDPLHLARELASQALPLLTPGALVAIEHGMGQRAIALDALTSAGLEAATGIDDLAGVDRVATARAPGGAHDGGFAPLRTSARDGRAVLVRQLGPDDADAYIALSAEVIAAGVGVPQAPGESMAPRERLTQGWHDRRLLDLYLGVFDAEHGGLLGEASLRRITLRRVQHVAILGIAVAPTAQGLGIGRMLTRGLLDWARAQAALPVHRLELYVFADNERAISLYRSVGFEEEGRRRDFLRRADGTGYVDDLVMGLLLG